MQRLAVLVIFAGLIAVPLDAVADDAPFTIGSKPIWFVSAGVNTGATVALDDKGFLVGGEVSISRIKDRHYFGLYADGTYDWGVNAPTVSAGPEFGLIRRAAFLPLGIGLDGGLALRFNDRTEIGGVGRVFATLGAGVAVYGRYLHFGNAENEQVVSIGLTLKMPLFNSF